MRFIRLHDYTWWIWLVIAGGLLVGMLVSPVGLWVALALSAVQAIAFLIKERSLMAFPVQLRVGYLLIIGVFAIPVLRVLLWIPMIGTFVLCFSGYCQGRRREGGLLRRRSAEGRPGLPRAVDVWPLRRP